MAFIRFLMKAAVAVFSLIPLAYCHDFFVFGGHRIEFFFRFAQFLSEAVLLQATLQSITIMIAALMLAVAVMWFCMLMFRWIDRALEKWS